MFRALSIVHKVFARVIVINQTFPNRAQTRRKLGKDFEWLGTIFDGGRLNEGTARWRIDDIYLTLPSPKTRPSIYLINPNLQNLIYNCARKWSDLENEKAHDWWNLLRNFTSSKPLPGEPDSWKFQLFLLNKFEFLFIASKKTFNVSQTFLFSFEIKIDFN